MQVFKTKWFARYATRENLDDNFLSQAIKRVESGLVDADLGGNLIKVRVPRKGQGRSSGYRMFIAYKREERAVFLYGFAKNERENIDNSELISLRELALAWLNASDQKIKYALSNHLLREVPHA